LFAANGTLLAPAFPIVDSYSYPEESGLCVSGDAIAFVTQSGGPDSLHYGVLNTRTHEIKQGVLSATEPDATTCVAHADGFSMIWRDDESNSVRQRFVYLDGTVGQHTIEVDYISSAPNHAGLFQACSVNASHSVLLYESRARDQINAVYMARGYVGAATNGKQTTLTNWGAVELSITLAAL